MAQNIEMKLHNVEELTRTLRDVVDFPKPGIVFKDITPILASPAALSLAVEFLTQPFRDQIVDVVVGAESRGFIFGTAVARNLSAGFVPVRKPGKLPGKTLHAEYQLEYGTDSLEIHEDAITPGAKVLLIDDLLATGGTIAACCDLVRQLKGEVIGAAFLIELCSLRGRDKLDIPVHTVIKIED